MHAGILFADLRGFTARVDGGDPEEASNVLRRFYRCAEDVLFPDAVIDKLIGDEVMALYLPVLKKHIMSPSEVPMVMLEHARGLLRAVGYGSGEEPFVEMGIGLDVGKRSSGTSVSVRCMTSQLWVTSSTRPLASKPRPRAERSCSPTVWPMA